MEIRCYDGNKYEILCIMSLSNAVMNVRAGREIGWMDSGRLPFHCIYWLWCVIECLLCVVYVTSVKYCCLVGRLVR